MIKAIQDDLASQIFRVQGNGGQPPAVCHSRIPGLNITVKYKYTA